MNDSSTANVSTEYFDLIYYSWFARILERISLSILIVLGAIILMIMLWKKFQNVDINFAMEKGTLQANLTFSMPVFLLLTIILFAYISYSHPIKVEGNFTEKLQTTPDSKSKVEQKAQQTTISLAGYKASLDELEQVILSMNTLSETSQKLQQARLAGGNIKDASELINMIGRVATELRTFNYKLIHSQFSNEEITKCRSTKSKNESLDDLCKRYYFLLEEKL